MRVIWPSTGAAVCWQLRAMFVCVCVRPHVVKEEGETWTAFLPLATHTLTYRLLIIRQVLSSSINRKTAAARRRVPFVAYYIPSSHILFFFALFFSTCRHETVRGSSGVFHNDRHQMPGRPENAAGLSGFPSDLSVSRAIRRSGLQRFPRLPLRSSVHGLQTKR